MIDVLGAVRLVLLHRNLPVFAMPATLASARVVERLQQREVTAPARGKPLHRAIQIPITVAALDREQILVERLEERHLTAPSSSRHACYHAGMTQLTIRLADDLVEDLRRAAGARGQSVNAWVNAVLRAATDPDLGGSEAERTRDRLRRAGLLATAQEGSRQAPDPEAVVRARRRAGTGTPLSQLVSEGRS